MMFESTKKKIEAIRAIAATTLMWIYGVASEKINIKMIKAE